MKLTHLKPDQYRTIPWKNGRGSTTEIAIHPPGATLATADFDWRFSSADVSEDGPFSRFPGYEGHLAILQGRGMILDIQGQTKKVDGDRVVQFSGDDEIFGRLTNGPIRDLNLIVLQKKMTGRLTLFNSPPPQLRLEADVALIFLISGRCSIAIPGAGVARLEELGTLVIEGNTCQQIHFDALTGTTRIAVAELRSR